jgi:hypothetical protein
MALRNFMSRLFFLPVAGITLIASQASAEGLNGLLEWNYGNVFTKTEGSDGRTSESKTSTFAQRYNLTLDKTLLPNLRLAAGGIFSQENSRITSDAETSSSRTRLVRPSVDLMLNNTVYNAGAGYSRREESSSGAGSATTLIGEDYHAVFGWRPHLLPSVDLQLTRSDTRDADRRSTDVTSDRALLGVRYQPANNIDLRYQGGLGLTKDRLQEMDTREIDHSGRVSYSDDFFSKRVSLLATYAFSRQEISISSKGSGEAEIPLFSFGGLSSVTDTPTLGPLDPNNALIDGNTTAGAGVNIGVPAIEGNQAPRNIGVDLFEPVDVNSISVWIDRELPAAIANSFSWDVYVSRENPTNGIQTWEPVATVAPAPFGPFQNRFRIGFPTTKTRFVKVVVRPLPAAVAAGVPGFADPGRILVTEVQASLKTAAGAGGTITRNSHIANFFLRTRLTERPLLYLENSLFLSATGSPMTLSYTVSNGISAEHRINDKFTLAGRLAREDAEEAAGHRSSYLLTASLRATPVRTVTQSVVYSGRLDRSGTGKSSSSNSVFLSNSLEVYRGIHVNASGGVTSATAETGLDTLTYTLLGGASITPHRTVSVNLNYSLSDSTTSGNGSPKSGQTTQRGDAGVSWRPFPAVYLFGSVGIIDRDGKSDATENYGLTWSPFPDGALQFSFSASENLATQSDSRVRLISPTVSWRIGPRMLLDGSYVYSLSKSATETSASDIYNVNFKVFF